MQVYLQVCTELCANQSPSAIVNLTHGTPPFTVLSLSETDRQQEERATERE